MLLTYREQLFDLAIANSVAVENDLCRITAVVTLVRLDCSQKMTFELGTELLSVFVLGRERDVLRQSLIEGAYNGTDRCILFRGVMPRVITNHHQPFEWNLHGPQFGTPEKETIKFTSATVKIRDKSSVKP